MGWVAGCGGLTVLAILAGVILYIIANRQIREWEERIEREGDLLLCWVASADKTLYEVYDVPGFANARVVFSTTSAPDLEQQLKRASRRLMNGKLVDDDVDTDRVLQFYDKVKDQRWLHPPLRIPKWLAGDLEVYTAMVQVYWRRLPEMCLTLPYLYCRVLLGEDGGVVMVEYPRKGASRPRADFDEDDEDDRRVRARIRVRDERPRRRKQSGFPVWAAVLIPIAVICIGLLTIVVVKWRKPKEPDNAAVKAQDNAPAQNGGDLPRPPGPVDIPGVGPAVEPPPEWKWAGGTPTSRPDLPAGWKVTKALGGGFANLNYSDYRQDGSIVIGFEVGLGKVFDTDIISYLRPIWLTPAGEQMGTAYGKKPMTVKVVKARDGYALGGVAVYGGGALEGITFTFMRRDGKGLNPNDWYTSEWLGEQLRRPPEDEMRVGDGSPVVGIHGLRFADKGGDNFDNGGAICTIGLVIAPRGVSGGAPGKP